MINDILTVKHFRVFFFVDFIFVLMVMKKKKRTKITNKNYDSFMLFFFSLNIYNTVPPQIKIMFKLSFPSLFLIPVFHN